ncbi:SDR family oxidoreductase [Sphingomonas sp. 28-63-12]|uniref:SDR family NAD(P)-dependent oxidoreductase n=1 Tax=Sphingomonas sp. 28-63-12 TaxID=1970434 RepID=UPI000BD18494|nr:MAG: hypothetical protein B7Y47_15400 [Sphingomonas sp. 28-63-12]
MKPETRTTGWTRIYGPWALVTGASDGIGRAIASDCAARGLNLILVARNQVALDLLAAELTRAHLVRVRVVAADLGDSGALDRLLATLGDIDIGLLVLAAGFGTAGSFLATDLTEEQAMLAVNCGAVLTLSHALAPGLVARGRGGIILFSSIVAFQGVARAAHYAATKAYNHVLAEGLSRELAPLGIDVLACTPGPVASGFAARSQLQMGAAANPQRIAHETLQALGKRHIVRPGLQSKLLIYGLSTLPRVARGAIMSAIMAGMTRHHHDTKTNTYRPA